MKNSEELARERLELWAGNNLNPHTWPDVMEAIDLAKAKLQEALDHQELGAVTLASYWFSNIADILQRRALEIEAEIEEDNRERLDSRRG